MEEYLFTSKRLGFRNWKKEDLAIFTELNADPDVMEHFPKVLSQKESETFMLRMQAHYKKHGYTYFAVDILNTRQCIGFIGLAFQEYQAPFTPAVDIGWRLGRKAWGKGYATEGAARCLKFGFEALNLHKIVAVCTSSNDKSERVMQKIGMQKKGSFLHPKLDAYPDYQECCWYESDNLAR